jgi:hypothetical protein
MLDRGIDGLVHRLADAAYLALQVKTKTSLKSSEGPIAVYEKHLFNDDQLIIGVSLEGDRLGPYVLVADGATYRRKAARIVDRGRTMLVADMPVRPIPGHKWSEDLVPLEQLASRLGASRAAIGVAAPLPWNLRPNRTRSSASGVSWRFAATSRHSKTVACSAHSPITRSRKSLFAAWPVARRSASR